jgi:hypothetical protein
MFRPWRLAKLTAPVALALLFLAMVHPLVHAITDHGGADGCALCQIYLSGALMLSYVLVCAVVTAIVAPLRTVVILTYGPCCLAPPVSRGPPQ